jgi:hypothetical protein
VLYQAGATAPLQTYTQIGNKVIGALEPIAQSGWKRRIVGPMLGLLGRRGSALRFKGAEWSSDANRDVHADKHGHEFGGTDSYLSFEKAISENPKGFVEANKRCDERGCTTGRWHPKRKLMFVQNDAGKTVTLYRRKKPPKELR